MESELATLHELQTVYGMEDLYDFLEIIAIRNTNQWIIAESQKET